MTLLDKFSISVQILTLIAATFIGVTQNQINQRQAQLQDYVAIAASPDVSGSKITLLNTGKVNLYINKILIGDQTVAAYDRPRLLPTGTLESSYYWVNPPDNLPLDQDFDLKIYVTDEYGTNWVSDNGGQVHLNNDQRVLNLWSYRMEKLNLNF